MSLAGADEGRAGTASTGDCSTLCLVGVLNPSSRGFISGRCEGEEAADTESSPTSSAVASARNFDFDFAESEEEPMRAELEGADIYKKSFSFLFILQMPRRYTPPVVPRLRVSEYSTASSGDAEVRVDGCPAPRNSS